MSKSKAIIASIIICTIIISLAGGIIIYISLTPDLSLMVLSDTHVMTEDQIGNDKSISFREYDTDQQNMLFISEAIFKTAIDNFIKSKSKILLISGDLSNNNAKISQQAVARELKRAEDAGKQVFVINGNHDTKSESYNFSGDERVIIESTSIEEFAEIYADFGYNEAVCRDTETLSYSANLNKKYRLIAIDSANIDEVAEDGDTRIDNLINWTVNEINKAYEDGMIPIGMTHYPILQHMGSIAGTLGESGNIVVSNNMKFAESLIDAGLHFILTGHMHAQDVTSFTTENGTLYDIETTCLISNPGAYRTLKFYKNNMKIEAGYIDSINRSHLPSYLSSEEKDVITADFTKFKEDYFYTDIYDKILNGFSVEKIVNLIISLGIEINEDNEDDVNELAEDIYNNLLLKVMNMPLYNKDVVGEELNLESILSEFNITIPMTDYDNIFDLTINFVKQMYRGDENFTESSPEIMLFKYSVYAVLYCVADYDLFGKLNAIDSNISDIDLMQSMNMLFTEGALDVDQNGLLNCLMSLDVITDLLPFSVSGNAKGILNFAKIFLNANFVLGMNLSPYIDSTNGTLLLGNIIDVLITEQIGSDILYDSGPLDNNLSIDLVTYGWEPISKFLYN